MPHSHAELRALSWRISFHALEYSLTISRFTGARRGVFSIVLVGNQIAESGRLPVGPAVVAAACISIVLALLPAEHEAQMDGYLLATKAAQLFPS
jgi:hypothetical protein